jgi:protein-L-isoaspartate(D-aspartate) O-methyltransferase
MVSNAEFIAEARERMLTEHLAARGITSMRVLEAMARVPRERFLPADLAYLAYADEAVPIGCGQTISQPLMVAIMTQALELTGAEHVLEVGTGSGYQTAVLAESAHRVVSIERHAALSRDAGIVLDELGYRNVRLVVGDGTAGWPEEAPYDRILVTAAGGAVPPALVDQLADGGILVIPVGGSRSQVLRSIRKTGGRVEETALTPCRFVPLVGAEDATDSREPM